MEPSTTTAGGAADGQAFRLRAQRREVAQRLGRPVRLPAGARQLGGQAAQLGLERGLAERNAGDELAMLALRFGERMREAHTLALNPAKTTLTYDRNGEAITYVRCD